MRYGEFKRSEHCLHNVFVYAFLGREGDPLDTNHIEDVGSAAGYARSGVQRVDHGLSPNEWCRSSCVSTFASSTSVVGHSRSW